MELYDRGNDGEQDPSMEWGPTGGVTGLEEPMMRLGIGSMEMYPERPGMPDCTYYMRTGTCGFGSRCRYNHPHDRSAAAAAMRSRVAEYPERVGEPFCRYYMKTGTCKFGMSCKFHHPKNEGRSTGQVPVNIYGYPLRPGENECSYYLKTGQCKFGVTCKFHHPQPAGISGLASAPTFYPMVQSPSAPPPEQYGGASTSWRVGRPPLVPGSYMPGSYGPVVVSPGVVPVPGWSPYSAPVSPVPSPGAQPTIGMSSLYGIAQHSPSTSSPVGQYPTLLPLTASPTSSEQTFPERPGQPECEYYMRNGDCKFGSSCKYHHPKQRVTHNTNAVLSPMGLPLRPGVQPCTFYLQHGICKFGPTCKFDHPIATMRYSPSASSLTDMPVAPYPVGASQATLAPSFSSSDLRPELIAGARRDSYKTTMPPSGTASSSSVGLAFSQTTPVSLSDAQLSSQITSSISSSRNSLQGSEVRRSSS